MALDCIANAKLEDTGFNYTMSLIQGILLRIAPLTRNSG